MINEKIKIVFHENKNMNEYIAKIEIPIPKGPPEFVFIIDSSGSMIGFFEVIIKEIIPDVLKKLKFEQEKIHLITFSDQVNYYNLTIDELINSDIKFGGGTFMSGVYDKLEDVFKNFEGKNTDIRIFTISDGVIFDQKETKEKGDKFFNEFSKNFKKSITINSQCLRLKTSEYTDPDTEALCSILRLSSKEGVKSEIIFDDYSNDKNFDKSAEFWVEVGDYEESEEEEEKEEKSEEEKKQREEEKKQLKDKITQLYKKQDLIYEEKAKLKDQSDDFTKKLLAKLCENINIPFTENINEIIRQYNKKSLLENKENFVNKIYNLFKDDGLGKEGLFKVSSKNSDIREIPWENGKNSGKLSSGNNTIWLNEIKNLSIQNELNEDISFDIENGQEITKNNYLEIISEDKITYIVQKTIYNKVINTNESNKENQKAAEYFKNLEEKLNKNDDNKQESLITNLLNDVINSNINNLDNNKIANYIKEKEEKIKKKLKKNKTSQKKNFILIIDNSNSMKNYIDDFLQKVLYNSLIKLGYINEDLINIITFNNKIKQNNIAVEDLPEFSCKIKNEISERNLSDVFNLIAKIVLNDLNTIYQLLFLFSGKITDEDASQLKAYHLSNSLKNIANVESDVIYYNINDEQKDKSSEINKEINFVLRNLTSSDINIESPICEMNCKDENEEKINTIVSIFSKFEKNEKRNSINTSNSSFSVPSFLNSSNCSVNDNFKTILINKEKNENILDEQARKEKMMKFIEEIRNKLNELNNICQIF